MNMTQPNCISLRPILTQSETWLEKAGFRSVIFRLDCETLPFLSSIGANIQSFCVFSGDV